MKSNAIYALVLVALSAISFWYYGSIIFSIVFPKDGLLANCFTPPLYACIINLGLSVIVSIIGLLAYKSLVSMKTVMAITLLLIMLGLFVEFLNW